jgi:hypothetical protein
VKPQLNRVSEEIVRWALEVRVAASQDWFVAFTNPTAGPWKKVNGRDSSSKEGEVHRFEVDETRPDLILVSDRFRTVFIIEAKTDFGSLMNENQMQKTAQLFDRFEALLKSKAANLFWADRSNYAYALGLLWGEPKTTASQRHELCQKYRECMASETQDVCCFEAQLVDNQIVYEVSWGIKGDLIDLDNYGIANES